MNKRINDFKKTAFGQNGSKAIVGTSEVKADDDKIFTCLYAMSDCVVSAQVDEGVSNADLTSLVAIPEGLIVYGLWSSITLSSGDMIGYYA